MLLVSEVRESEERGSRGEIKHTHTGTFFSTGLSQTLSRARIHSKAGQACGTVSMRLAPCPAGSSMNGENALVLSQQCVKQAPLLSSQS